MLKKIRNYKSQASTKVKLVYGLLLLIVLAAIIIGGYIIYNTRAERRRQERQQLEWEHSRFLAEQEQLRKQAEKRRRQQLEEIKRQQLAAEEKERQRWLNPVNVGSERLYALYKQNELYADALYKGQVLLVEGEVVDIGRDILGQAYVILAGEGEWLSYDNYLGFGVQCFFAPNEEIALRKLSKHNYVSILGECKGKGLASILLKKCKLKSSRW